MKRAATPYELVNYDTFKVVARFTTLAAARKAGRRRGYYYHIYRVIDGRRDGSIARAAGHRIETFGGIYRGPSRLQRKDHNP